MRLVIAPLSSWAVDTPGFVLSSVSVVYSGSPYGATTWFNPPLAPYLAEPFIALLVSLSGPQSLFVSVPAIAPVAIATGVDATVFPTSAALLAWKLPLIVSDLGVALLLLRIGRARIAGSGGDWMAMLWFLNPLVIWASSVHGEVDTLAIFFVLLAIVQAVDRHWVVAGLALGLAVFAKGYPIALLPVFAGAAFADGAPGATALADRLRSAGRWGVGLALSAIPFLYILPQTEEALLAKAGSPTYGGISVLGVFNAASPRIPGEYTSLTTASANAALVFELLRIVALVAILGASAAVFYRLRSGVPTSLERTTALGAACLLAAVAIFVADSAPQPENLLGVLVLLLVAAPLWAGRAPTIAFSILTAAGLTMYLSFLTPFGMFYPLAWMLGPGAIAWVNHVAIAYIAVPGLRGGIWLVVGIIGGATVLAVGASAALRLFVRPLWHRLRPAGDTNAVA